MTADYAALFEPIPVPEDLAVRAKEKGWPDDVLGRMFGLRWDRGGIEWWLSDDGPPLEQVLARLTDNERLTYGTIRARAITYDDGPALSELFAHSPEEIGDYDVVVERGPNAFAQFDLLENPVIWVLEDRRVLVGSFAVAARNCFVNGKRLCVSLVAAYRVRQEARGMGFSQLIRNWGVPPGQPYAPGQFWYIRSQNHGAVKWMDAIDKSLLISTERRDGDVPGIPATVHQYPSRPFDGDASGIRVARRGDTRRCAALINRTHKGLDLYRPYTAEYLRTRLDERFWGPRPHWWTPVYSWPDYHVLEEDGVVVACAGLWDRGRDMREVWTHRATGETKTIETTNVLDFGFAPGREDAMARLLEYLMGRTHALRRGFLVAPLQFLPDVAGRLEHRSPVTETRGLAWRLWRPDGPPYEKPPVAPVRPYTDLACW